MANHSGLAVLSGIALRWDSESVREQASARYNRSLLSCRAKSRHLMIFLQRNSERCLGFARNDMRKAGRGGSRTARGRVRARPGTSPSDWRTGLAWSTRESFRSQSPQPRPDWFAQLFRGMPFRSCFRLGRFVCGLVAGLAPFGMENSWFIDAFVGVGAEEIALCLQQIRRQTR